MAVQVLLALGGEGMIPTQDLVALDVRRRAAVCREVSLLPALEARRVAQGVPQAPLFTRRGALTPPTR
eukprot:3225491-Rhodomonas_salina.1